MSYKIEKPSGAPDWFVPGIVCKVNNKDGYTYNTATLIWYDGSNMPYIDSEGLWWVEAEPIEEG